MFRKIAEGDVFATTKDASNASGPRSVVLADGSLACAFMLNSKSGGNDFVPMIAYSADGAVWTEAKPVWPELEGKKSAFVSLRGAEDGQVCLAGKAWEMAYPGEPFWSDEAAGMKENKLVFSISSDGHSFPLPMEVDVPFYGSAEQPGGMLAENGGKLTMIYSPYPTIEKKEDTVTDASRVYVIIHISSSLVCSPTPKKVQSAIIPRSSKTPRSMGPVHITAA